ncbi:MAG: hypothetical protein ACI9FY_001064, partial [Patiriisocius sp.]
EEDDTSPSDIANERAKSKKTKGTP